MVLNADQVSDYHDRGFTVVHNFFNSSEIAVMRGELQRLLDAGCLNNVATDGDGVTQSTSSINLQICPLSPESEVLRTLPFAQKVVGLAQQLLGESVVHRLDQIFLKPAGNGSGTNWHQDNGYFSESRGQAAFQGFGLWIAMHDASLANGTMQLIPHRHTEILPHLRDGGSNHHVTCAAAIDPAAAIPVEVPAGGVAIFNYGVPHSTGANTTSHDRAGLALHFLREDAVSDSAPNIRGPTISGPACDGGVSMWGNDLRGAWEALVAESHASLPSAN
jgi:ectoine hydroxylase-related dioxygenase (phytanoyl-CoA dioxygenase family)